MGATRHTSCCPGNKRHDGRPLHSPRWIRRHKALMAAYGPLPGGRQTAWAFKNDRNDSRDVLNVHILSAYQQLVVRHYVRRTFHDAITWVWSRRRREYSLPTLVLFWGFFVFFYFTWPSELIFLFYFFFCINVQLNMIVIWLTLCLCCECVHLAFRQ